MSARFIHVKSQKSVNPVPILTKQPTQYPSSYFESTKRKPRIVLKKARTTHTELRRAVVKGICDGCLTKDVAKGFLACMAEEIEAEIDKDWTSYQIKIASAGSTVKVADLIDIEYKEEEYTQFTSGSESTDVSDFDALLMVLFLHRMIRLNTNVNSDLFYSNVRKQLSNKQSNLYRNVNRVSEYTSWQADKELNILVAAFDMFMYRFPTHEYAAVRYGSVTTRFRDCAGLISVGHLCDLVGMPVTDIPDWIFNLTAGTELISLFEPSDAEESSDPFSYFPYHSDMGLVTKSPYSSVAVPNLFFILHATGSLLRSPRSLNARMNTESNIEILIKNALIIASAFKGFTRLEKAFTVDGQGIDVDKIIGEGEEEDDTDYLISNNPSEIFDFMARRQFRPTTQMRQILQSFKRDVKDLREGTIGKFLSTYSFE